MDDTEAMKCLFAGLAMQALISNLAVTDLTENEVEVITKRALRFARSLQKRINDDKKD